jgi:hypothetical protein
MRGSETDDPSTKLIQTGPTQEEIDKVEALMQREKTHWQWDKHIICVIVLVS